MRPKIIVSRCLGFEECRWNGKIIQNKVIEYLLDKVEIITVCPETGIGLSIPRDPIKLHYTEGRIRAIQDNSFRDITDDLRDYSISFISENKDVKGFILKSRSPSCGFKSTPIFGAELLGSGIFVEMVKSIIPEAVIIDEKIANEPEYVLDFLRKISS